MNARLLAVSCLVFAAGCASQPRVAGKPSEDASKLFDQIKSLAGEWTSKDENGKTMTASVFTVTASGSAVREVMMPGTAYEMTNVYHLDGSSVVMTHYCAQGNQPRLRATPGKPGEIVFAFDSVTNLADAHTTYMGGLTLKMKDKDHLTADWASIKDGVTDKNHAVFELTRKKG